MVTKRTILTIHSFFSIGFSFMNILETQESRGRGRLFLWLLSTTSTRFTQRSPFQIPSSWTRTENLWLSHASQKMLNRKMSSVAENSETLKKGYALQKGVQGELQPGTSGFFYHLWSVVFLIFLFFVRIHSQLTQKPFDNVSFF